MLETSSGACSTRLHCSVRTWRICLDGRGVAPPLNFFFARRTLPRFFQRFRISAMEFPLSKNTIHLARHLSIKLTAAKVVALGYNQPALLPKTCAAYLLLLN